MAEPCFARYTVQMVSDFVMADLLVVFFRVRNCLVLEWDFLSVFCCSISSWLRLSQGPASSPAVHLTFRALPGLKPELVCFLLSVCWSQGRGSETETFGKLRLTSTQPPIKSYTHCHPPADSVVPPQAHFLFTSFIDLHDGKIVMNGSTSDL